MTTETKKVDNYSTYKEEDNYIFFLIVSDRGKRRLKPLGGQKSSLGDRIDSTRICRIKASASDVNIATADEVGAVFVSNQYSVILDSSEKHKMYEIEGNISSLKEVSKSTTLNEDVKDKIESLYTKITKVGSTSSSTTPKTETTLDKLKKLFPAPTTVKDDFYVEPMLWWHLIACILNGKNILIVGPTGSGKTELVSLLAKSQEADLTYEDMGAMQDPISGLIGVHRIEEGDSIFDTAKFVENIQKEYTWVLLDEINRAPAEANNVLFPVLDSRRKLPLSVASSKDSREVEVNEDCVFFATANIGSSYTGTNSIDRALLDRFITVELGYLPPKEETELLVKRTDKSHKKGPKLDKIDSKLIVKLANKTRKLNLEGDLSSALSVRHTLSMAESVRDGFNLKDAFTLNCSVLYEGTEKEGERSTIYEYIKTIS